MLSSGHVFDSTPGRAEVVFTGGLTVTPHPTLTFYAAGTVGPEQERLFFDPSTGKFLDAKGRGDSTRGLFTILTTYKPTVLVSEKRAELHVQRSLKGNVIVPGKPPEGGDYFLVADATPLDRNRTRIDIYAPSIGANTLIRAVTGWATGENVGCPDMTKS